MQQGQNLTRHGEQKRQRKPRGQKEKQQRAEQEQQRREREQEQKQQRRGREQEQKQQRAQCHMQRMLVQEGLEQPGAAQPQPAASVLVGSGRLCGWPISRWCILRSSQFSRGIQRECSAQPRLVGREVRAACRRRARPHRQ